MNLGPHTDINITSYAVTASVVAGVIAWVVLDHFSLKRMLGDLDEQGVTRRSRKKE